MADDRSLVANETSFAWITDGAPVQTCRPVSPRRLMRSLHLADANDLSCGVEGYVAALGAFAITVNWMSGACGNRARAVGPSVAMARGACHSD
jgi:hypothetical protein